MERRRLGRTNLHVSVLGFGSAPAGFLGVARRDIETLLNTVLDSGINLIDTAAAYPGSEEAIGHALKHRRDEYVLVTKCGSPGTGADDVSWKPQAIVDSIDRSLQRLQSEVLDVVLLHSCDVAVLRQGDALDAVVAARDAGKVRHVGYSGDNEAARFAASLPEMEVLEMSVNICDQGNIAGVFPVAAEKDLGVIAKRPMANAAWKDLDQQQGIYQAYAEPYTRRMETMALDPADLNFAGEPHQRWPEIALRFVLSFPEVAAAVVGTTSGTHLAANIEIAARGGLSEQAIDALRAAFSQSAASRDWNALT